MSYIFWFIATLLIMSAIPLIVLRKALLLGHRQKIILFSPLQGKLTYKSDPVAGAKIIRKVSWNKKIVETDIFYGLENGEFNLPLKEIITRVPGLTQFVVHQTIHVYFNNQEFPVWSCGKLGKDVNAELGGKPINLMCELTDEIIRAEATNGILVTSFKWDYIEKPDE